jgi:hypothetical protein
MGQDDANRIGAKQRAADFAEEMWRKGTRLITQSETRRFRVFPCQYDANSFFAPGQQKILWPQNLAQTSHLRNA